MAEVVNCPRCRKPLTASEQAPETLVCDDCGGSFVPYTDDGETATTPEATAVSKEKPQLVSDATALTEEETALTAIPAAKHGIGAMSATSVHKRASRHVSPAMIAGVTSAMIDAGRPTNEGSARNAIFVPTSVFGVKLYQIKSFAAFSV